MEVRCSRCYSTKIYNNLPMISPHSHPTVSNVEAPVGVKVPPSMAFKQLKVDLCGNCGYVLRTHI